MACTKRCAMSRRDSRASVLRLRGCVSSSSRSVSGTLVRQQELLATCDSRLVSVERERDRLLVELRTYFEQQESRLRAEAELRHERDRLHLENQELRATLDAMKRQLAQPSGDAGSRNYPSERLSVEPRSAELATNHPSAKEVLSTMRGTLMRLLPAVPPDSTPIEQWPRDSPTDRDHWKHWLVPVVWPALSDIVNELHPTSSDEAARVRSELAPVTIVAAQLYLGLLLIAEASADGGYADGTGALIVASDAARVCAELRRAVHEACGTAEARCRHCH
jgi:hypothetical protein